MFGDGSRPAVLEAAGVENPRAFLVSHRNKEQVRSRAGGQGEVLCAFLVGHQNQEQVRSIGEGQGGSCAFLVSHQNKEQVHAPGGTEAGLYGSGSRSRLRTSSTCCS